MTREEFIDEIDSQGYSFREEGDKLIIGELDQQMDLVYLKSIPTNVKFNNKGTIMFWNLDDISSGVEFNNKGHIYLEDLKSIPPGVEFNNEGSIELRSIIGGWNDRWKGNIEGIDSNRLLNKMISLGLFER
jgi:hypothetical protein